MSEIIDLQRQTPAAHVAPHPVMRALQSWGGLLEALPIGVYTCDGEGTLIYYNARAAELWGRSPPLGNPAIRYCGALNAFGSEGKVLLPLESPMAELLETGEPVRARECVIERPDGTQLEIMANLDPLFDEDGDLVGGVNCFQDISPIKRSERAAAEREIWYRELLESLPAAIYTTDAQGRVTFYNQAAADLAGHRPVLGSDQWCVTWRLRHPDGTPLAHDECPMAIALREQRPVRGVEALAERPDGTLVPFLPYPTPLRDQAGAIVGAVNMLVDITERKRAEERQRALLDELNHRVKNTLAIVQSLAAQTVRTAPDLPAFKRNFESRLVALSRAHDMLTRQGWEGASFREIVTEELAPYAQGEPGRIILDGPDLLVQPAAALALTMVVHELASNAVKYGALSAAGGSLHLQWRVDPAPSGAAMLQFDWREEGGPPVAPPARSGFGSKLIERSIAGELQGKSELIFDPAGLRCRIDTMINQPTAA
jgi:PAS domain S-box-containing protein